MNEYNMPNIGLFGKRCLIPTGYSNEQFVYRIVNSGIKSNTWSEIPLTYKTETNPEHHNELEDVLIVVCDTMISERSRLIRVALKDIKVIEEE